GIFSHVAPRVDMHEGGYGGDDHQHHCGQRVHTQHPVERQRTRLYPLQNGHDFGRHTAAKVFKEDRPAKSTGYDQRTCRQDLGPDIAERPLAEAGHDSRQQRQEYDYQDGVHVLPLHPVDVIDRDGAAAAEVDDQNGQPDRRLAGSDGQDEHGEDLPRQVAEEGAEGDEVDVHRKQDQLDRHQDHDDVLPIEKDAEHA